MCSVIKKVSSKEMFNINTANTSVGGKAVGSLVNEVIDVVDQQIENLSPLANIAGNDGYTITDVINVDGKNVAVASADGKNSMLYVTDGDNNLIGKIDMDTNEKVVDSVYNEKDGTITVLTESGKKITYDVNRIEASIKLAEKYEHTNSGKYYNTDGDKYVEVARNELGKEYVWGASGPDAFDCSGLVGYVVTGRYERIGTTYTFMEWPEVSEPIPGDICVNESHTGIYIGNGKMIHAATEGVGVIEGPVQDGMKFVRYDGRCD